MEDNLNMDDSNELVSEPHDYYNSLKDFTTLEAWRKCRTVKLYIYNKIIPLLPEEEKYNLNVQMRRASISITSNIAEGYGRFHHREAIQFLRISRGSLYELKDNIICCKDLKYINNEFYNEGVDLIEDAKITLNGYINYLDKKITK